VAYFNGLSYLSRGTEGNRLPGLVLNEDPPNLEAGALIRCRVILFFHSNW
jgi:hypothetical protein